jgi:hypothetical protein
LVPAWLLAERLLLVVRVWLHRWQGVCANARENVQISPSTAVRVARGAGSPFAPRAGLPGKPEKR